MTTLFEEGRRQVRAGTAWRHTPPGVAGGEELLQRAGTNLTIIPQAARNMPLPIRPEELPLPMDSSGIPPSPID